MSPNDFRLAEWCRDPGLPDEDCMKKKIFFPRYDSRDVELAPIWDGELASQISPDAEWTEGNTD